MISKNTTKTPIGTFTVGKEKVTLLVFRTFKIYSMTLEKFGKILDTENRGGVNVINRGSGIYSLFDNSL